MLAWAGVAQAQACSSNTQAVAATETVDGTLFAAGRTVDIAGTVNGDVFCAGREYAVSGTVNGDVICAAQARRVSGTVEGDVRAAGRAVTIGDGRIAGNRPPPPSPSWLRATVP